MRKFGSIYEHGRSNYLFKFKASHGDQEGIVVGKDPQNSVQLKMTTGQIITVNQEGVQIPPNEPELKIGDIVTYSYDVVAKNVPVNPIIYRIRTDVSWGDVLQNALTEKPRNNSYIDPWTVKDMRMFLETFARRRKGADPLVPETWYNITPDEILQSKTGRSILQKFKGYYDAVKTIFPEINFHKHEFLVKLNNVGSRRRFFEYYAMKHNFDPLIAENWYNQSRKTIKDTKGASVVISYHQNSLVNALVDLFPDIGLDTSRFSMYRHAANRRKYFEIFARNNGFDPLIPDNWYTISNSKYMELKDITKVISHHGDSVSRALVELFPELKLDESKFWSRWNSSVNRRQFLLNFAKANQFDPLLPDNWNAVKAKFVATKGAKRVLSYHGNIISKALQDLFPDIDVDKHSFAGKTSGWRSTANRKKFLESYAKESGFDPLIPENWYKQRIHNFRTTTKGSHQVFKYHKGSWVQAVLDLFPNIGLEKEKFTSAVPAWNDYSTRRKFFLKYANENNFDPLVPTNWYSQRREAITSSQGGAYSVLAYHKHSVLQALSELFPEIGITESAFRANPWWSFYDSKLRRKFFEDYAKDKFDPLIAQNWYSYSKSLLLEHKNISTVISYHRNSLSQAVVELFPEVELDTSQLWPANSWEDSAKRRKFFEEYARANNFNPLDFEHWRSQSKLKILAVKGATQLLRYHNYSVATALAELFPEVTHDGSKPQVWVKWCNDKENRRKFFENLAQEQGFNSQNPEDWYKLRKQKVLTVSGVRGVLSHHGNSVSRALLDLFPDIGLQKDKFHHATRTAVEKQLKAVVS